MDLSLENTILKWSSDHRKHHNKPETEDDPYSITKGFWYAHIGWVIENTSEEKNKVVGKRLRKKSCKISKEVLFFDVIIGGFIVPLMIGLSFDRPIEHFVGEFS